MNGVILLDTYRMRILKCDHCNGDPECAKICPTRAIKYGPSYVSEIVDRHGKVTRYLKEIRRQAEAQESGGES